MITLSLFLCLFYAALVTAALWHWRALPVWELPKDFQPHTTISVLVPARNEAANIAACVETVLQQNYPPELFELIVIDDHSTDATAAIVQGLQHTYPQLRLLHLSDFINNEPLRAYKKKALEVGIAQARGELIVTTDADCMAQPDWLRLLASMYEIQQARCIAAPVNFHQETKLLERFQSLDFAGTMLLTGAGIRARFMRLANGANLAYPKAVFEEVNGFAGIDHLASGDDMLLVQKIAARYPADVHFLKNAAATVFTYARPDWRSFLQQRIRWATKSSAYREWQITLMLAGVFFFCCNIVLCAVLSPFWRAAAVALGLQLAVKIFFDYQLLGSACRFFHRKDLMRHFLPAQVLHILYIVVLGFAANLIKQYEWKGRRVQ